MVDPDESDFTVATETELFPDGLKRALFNASEKNAHIFETRTQLHLSKSSILGHLRVPGAVSVTDSR